MLQWVQDSWHRGIFDAAPTPILIVAGDEAIVDANQAAQAFFDLSPADFGQVRISRFVPEPARARHSAFIRGYFADPRTRMMGGGNGGRLQIQTPHGLRTVSIGLSPLSRDGETLAIVTLQDQTRQIEDLERLEQARDEMLRVQRDLQATLNALPDLLLEFDAEGCYQAVHARREDLLLKARDQLIGVNVAQVLPADAAATVMAAIGECLARGASDVHLVSLPVRDEVRWFELSCARKEQGAGEPATCLMLSRDVTERVEAQRALTAGRENLEQQLALRSREIIAAHRHLQGILGSSPVPMLVVDAQGICTHWNRACEAYFDIPAEAMIGTERCWQAFYESPRPILAQLIARGEGERLREFYGEKLSASALVAGAYEVEAFFPRLQRWLFFTAAPLYDEAGERIGALETLQDVTARRQAEAESEAARRLAESASEAKSRFLAHMSHEIRTPLNGVIGLARLGLAQGSAGPLADVLQKIMQSGEHLRDLINDILDFSKIEAGQLILNDEDFSLLELVDRAIELTVLQARQKNLAFTVEVAPEVPARWRGDALRLKQCLVNLLGNAIKFTEEGHVALALCLEEGALKISVCDSGIGISEEALEGLFRPFTQASDSTHRQFGGTGLGLAITRELVERMGGRVVASSTPGVGSCFVLSLPCPADHAPIRLASLPAHVLIQGLPPGEASVLERGLRAFGVRCEIRPSALPPGGFAGDSLILSSEQLQAWRPFLAPRQTVFLPHPPGQRPVVPPLTAGRLLLWEQPLRLHHLPALLAEPVAGPPPGREPPPAARLAGCRLLAVDDNDVNLMVLEGLLSMEGARVEQATSAHEALRRIAQASPPFAAVITDIQMPVMDGYALSREIQRRWPGLPVIGVSANATARDLAASREAGMLAYLTKPVEAERLVQTLREFMRPAATATPLPLPSPPPKGMAGEAGDWLERLQGLLEVQVLLDNFRQNRGFIQRLLHAALTGNASLPASLRQAVDAADLPALCSLAHRARGMAASIRAPAVRQLGADVEAMALAGDPESVQRARQLIEAIEHLHEALRESSAAWEQAG